MPIDLEKEHPPSLPTACHVLWQPSSRTQAGSKAATAGRIRIGSRARSGPTTSREAAGRRKATTGLHEALGIG